MKRLTVITALLLALLMVLPYPAMAATVRVDNHYDETFTVKDSWFSTPTTLYNHELAQASMALAYAAYSGQSAVETALEAENFESITSKNYGWSETDMNLGFTIGKKVMEDGKTVYAVVFEDTKAKEDWSNAYDFVRVNGEFADPANQYQTDLIAPFFMWANGAWKQISKMLIDDSMIDEEDATCTGDFCVWISGFGRGGSAANMLGAMLNTGVISQRSIKQQAVVGTQHVRAYAFGAPAVSQYRPEDSSVHNNLFVINNPDDLLVYFPGWGFDWFGVKLDMRTFHDIDNKAPEEVKSNVETKYKAYTGKPEYYAYSHEANTEKGETNEDLLTARDLAEHIFNEIAPTISDYYTEKNGAVYNMPINGTSADQLLSALGNIKKEAWSAYGLLCQVFGSVFGDGDLQSLLGVVAGTYIKGQPIPIIGGDQTLYYKTVDFAVKHGLGIYSYEELTSILGSDMNSMKFRELLTAYEPESYLAWMMATDSAEELSMDVPPHDAVAIDSVANKTVTYSAENASGLADQVAAAAYTSEGKLLEVQFGELGAEQTVTFTTAETIGKVQVFLVDDQWAPLAPAALWPAAE